MNRLLITASASAAFLLTAAVVTANPGEHRFPISVAEIEARQAAAFARTDSDGDGLISPAEFDAHEGPGRRAHRGGKRADQDDPQAQAARRAELDHQLFQALDTDGNGTLSQSEFSSQALVEARRSTMRQYGFQRMDKDEDGYLSPQEFPPGRLAALDADGDGMITREEADQLRGRYDHH
jgi:Ca2+-binding EF-hand superfamily protein